MTQSQSRSHTAFHGHRLLASGTLADVAIAVKRADERGSQSALLVFDDETGRVVDLDLRGSESDIVARLEPSRPAPGPADAASQSRGRGRPKLGVVAREITLLPSHWEWLAAQPGGASVALRKLVHEARRSGGGKADMLVAQEAAYRFMSAMAGDLPGFEEASRALFANDPAQFARCIANWPDDVRAYSTRLAFGARAAGAVAQTEEP